MKKSVLFVLISLLLLCVGCGESSEKETPDRMIGVLATMEYPSFYQVSGSDAEQRIYSHAGKFDIEGMALYCPVMTDKSTVINDGFDIKNIAVSTSDMTIDAKLYVSVDAFSGEMYLNPVYQEKTGEIYIKPGKSASLNGNIPWGMVLNQSMDEKTKGEDGTLTRINIDTVFIPAPGDMTVYEFDRSHNIIKETTYLQGTPLKVYDAREAAYIIVEHKSKDGEVFARELLDPNSVDNCTLGMYRMIADGVCIKETTDIEW